MNCNSLMDRALRHMARVEVAERDIKDNKILIEEYTKKLQKETKNLEDTKLAYEYLDEIVKEESGRFIRRLNEILDYGVKTIFDDCEYSIDIRSDEGKITIHLVYQDEDGNTLSPDIQVCGGGIRSVVGILLQVFFIFHYRTYPVLFIDEGMSQISSSYIPNVMDLLNELADNNNLKIVLVTHDPRFMGYAKRRYVIEDGMSREVAVGGSNDTD